MKIGVTGHQELPDSAARFVEPLLVTLVREKQPTLGVSSLARGADQLFSQVMLEQNVPIKAIIPCRDYERTFVDPVALRNYQALLEFASAIEELDFAAPSQEAFSSAGRKIVDEVDLLVAIWDGKPARGWGGTGDIVDYALKASRRVIVLWPADVER